MENIILQQVFKLKQPLAFLCLYVQYLLSLRNSQSLEHSRQAQQGLDIIALPELFQCAFYICGKTEQMIKCVQTSEHF